MKNPNRTAREARRAETGDSTDTIVVCSGRSGTASLSQYEAGTDLKPLFDTIINYIEPPKGEENEPLQMLISSIDYNEYVGRIGIGRIVRGNIKVNQQVTVRNGCEGQHNIDFFILPGRIRRDRLKLLDRSLYKDFFGGGAYGLYDKADADLIIQRAESNYDGMSKDALEPLIMRILELN